MFVKYYDGPIHAVIHRIITFTRSSFPYAALLAFRSFNNSD